MGGGAIAGQRQRAPGTVGCPRPRVQVTWADERAAHGLTKRNRSLATRSNLTRGRRLQTPSSDAKLTPACSRRQHLLLSSSNFGIDFEEGSFAGDGILAWLCRGCRARSGARSWPASARSPLPARCGFPTLLAGPRLPCGAPRGRCASPDRHVCRRWRTLRCTLRRHPRPHTRCTDCPWARGGVRRAGAPGAAPSALRRGCSRCLGAAHSRLSGRAALSPLVRQPRALIARPPLSGGRRALTCVCGWTTLEGDGEAAATATASSSRCARITSPAAPTRASGSALAARRLPEGREPPDPSRPLCGGAAALARRRRCCLASRDVLSGIARRRLLCGNVAVCSATRRCGGSALPLSRRPASGPGNASCRRRGTLGSPLPARAADRAAAQSAAPSAASTAARRAALALAPAHALVACPPCRCARSDVRLSSKRSPSLTRSPGAAPPAPRRGRSRGLCALPTRGSAGGRHRRHSRASRGRSLPPRLCGKGGGRARVCGCVRPDDGEAAAPQPLCPKRAPRRGLASPASPTRASCSVLGEAPARGARASWPVASACGAAAARACRHRCRLALRDETLVFTAADALAATLRSAVRPAAVAAARSPRPAPGEWTRRYLLPSAWHARLSLGDALPAGPRRSPLPRRRPDGRCWCSLRRALWRRVRPPARRTACACMPEAICGRAQSCRRR